MRTVALALVVAGTLTTACGRSTDRRRTSFLHVPEYNEHTGRLQLLTADRNQDGRADLWAVMDGIRVMRIEIDRDADGKPDRWEFYAPDPARTALSHIVRAQESESPEMPARRREFYAQGELRLVEEDTDADGQLDSETVCSRNCGRETALGWLVTAAAGIPTVIGATQASASR